MVAFYRYLNGGLPLSPHMTTIWELDFYSRPIVDENGKKIWEVLVCDSPLDVKTQPEDLFRYAEYCASTEINSARLQEVLETALAQAPQPPTRIRFFRQAMNNMITKACEGVGIPALLSLRTYRLNQWLEQRMQEEYPKHPGFQAGANPSVSFAETAPSALPDALRGEKWAFVSLEAAALEDMTDWAIAFGEGFPLSLAGLEPDTLIPGLLIFTARATPMAAWMSGLELGTVTFDPALNQLLLTTGVNDRWVLASLNKADLQTEAQNFITAKASAKGVHFLAIQTQPDTEEFAGFWLLQDPKLA
jgi:hypothetical protein